MTQAWNPQTDPAGCSICRADAVRVDERNPGGNRKVRCPQGHVTNGMPSQAWMRENFPQGMERKP